MVALVLTFLLGLSQPNDDRILIVPGSSDGYGSPPTPQSKATADVTVIFREPFEEGLGSWASLSESDDTPESTGWEAQAALDAYDGTGLVQIKGYEDDPQSMRQKKQITGLASLSRDRF